MHFKGRKRKERAERTGPTGTQQATLSLYKQGLSIEEIARERGRAANTIEGHLSAFVADGSLDPLRLVPQQKLDKIAEIARQIGQYQAAMPLK